MKRTIIGLAAVVVFTASIAVATPSRGYITKLLGAATFDSLSIQPSGPSTTLFVRAEIEPGGTTGWHSHPAHVFVLVKQGRVAVINEGECTRTVYTRGEIFLETPGRVHKALNVGEDEVVLVATFVGLPPTLHRRRTRRIPAKADLLTPEAGVLRIPSLNVGHREARCRRSTRCPPASHLTRSHEVRGRRHLSRPDQERRRRSGGVEPRREAIEPRFDRVESCSDP